MNKRSLRIAGWAIGLSLAFGAIGAAVSASQTLNPQVVSAAIDESGNVTGDWSATTTSAPSGVTAGTDSNVTIGGMAWTVNVGYSGSGWAVASNSQMSATLTTTAYKDKVDSIEVGFSTNSGKALTLKATVGTTSLESQKYYTSKAVTSGTCVFDFSATNPSGTITIQSVTSNSKTTGGFKITSLAINSGGTTAICVVPSQDEVTLYTSGASSLTQATIGLTYPNFTSVELVTASSSAKTIVPENEEHLVFENDYSSLTIVGNGNAGSSTITVEAMDSDEEVYSCEISVVVLDNSKALVSIAVTTSPTKVNYVEGDGADGVLDLSGMVVTATYDDATTDDVTSSCVFSPANGASLTTANTAVSVSYTFGGTTKNTSQPISVAPYPYVLASSINGGDTIVIAGSAKTAFLSGINTSQTNHYGEFTPYSSTYVPHTYTFSVVAGATDGTVAFKHGSSYLSWSKDNTLTTSATVTSNSSWTVSIDNGGVATIANVNTPARLLRYNTNSRFACYTTNTGTLLTLYKLTGENTNALTFAASFNTTIESICDYDAVETDTSALASSWSVLAGDTAGNYETLSAADKAYIASFSANKDGNAIERMLAKYKYIYEKYGSSKNLTNFLGRTEISKAGSISPMARLMGEKTSLPFVFVVVGVGLAAACGLVFIHRRNRKEN